MRPFRYAAGWAELKVTGAEPEAFLTALGEKGVPFWDAAPPASFSLTLKVPARQADRVRSAAAACGCDCEITAVRGLPMLLRRVRRRAVFAVLLLAMLAALCASLSRIWEIEITGNETVPDGVIRQALAACGVDIGARWVGMSQDRVRNAVILRVPELRWMTVTMQGSRARVIVRERRQAVEPVPEDEYADVVADRAGIVTEVRALRGTAETAAGRAVLPGDVIVGGYATGRFGVQGPVRAIGFARVRTWYDLTMEAPAETAVKEPEPGRTQAFSLILGKKRINFYKGSSICPAGCDKIIKTYTLSLPGVFTLPISVERTVLRSFALDTERAEELTAELEAGLMAELERRIGGEGEVVSFGFTAAEQAGLLRVALRAECAENVGVTVPLTAEELEAIERKIPRTEEPDT